MNQTSVSDNVVINSYTLKASLEFILVLTKTTTILSLFLLLYVISTLVSELGNDEPECNLAQVFRVLVKKVIILQ